MISETDILKILKKILKTSDNIKEDFGIFENLDSLFFAELCMELEDKANELDFNFDWNSKNSIKNGIIALKGGDLIEELKSVPFKRIIKLNEIFDYEYFHLNIYKHHLFL